MCCDDTMMASFMSNDNNALIEGADTQTIIENTVTLSSGSLSSVNCVSSNSSLPPNPIQTVAPLPSPLKSPVPIAAVQPTRPTSLGYLAPINSGAVTTCITNADYLEKTVPFKSALLTRPSQYIRKSVVLERFRSSRTRRFFHPYKPVEIGAIQALKEVASSPDEVAAKFASEALTVIGEEVPYKLAQQVPSWTTNDVQYWVKKIGFEDYVDRFARQMVDGDLLLHLSERELEVDLEMQSGLHRKRFIRELESLKIAADYSGVDESNLDQLLMSLSPELSVYTYKMLSSGINRSMLAFLTDELMQTACGIMNPIHRLKLLQAFRDAKHPDDVEVAMLSKQIDVFISYRRSTGNQLASLIKVLLQLRGYKVFIDVDKLYAGKFDSSLLKNIQAAKHFILVLTPHSLDRLLNDHNCEDWIHKELRCAFQFNKNIIPIFDQSFEFPQDEDQIPKDVRHITKYNGVKWVHDYQDACMHKVVRFLEGELNRSQSMNQGSTSPSHGPSAQQVLNASNRRAHTNSARSVAPAIRSNPQSCRSFRLTEPTTPTRFKSSHSTANRSSGATSPVPSTVARESSRRKLIQSSVSTACDKS